LLQELQLLAGFGVLNCDDLFFPCVGHESTGIGVRDGYRVREGIETYVLWGYILFEIGHILEHMGKLIRIYGSEAEGIVLGRASSWA
jgi:hypothetical protein